MTIISLTSIPSRFAELPPVLHALLGQKAPIKSVQLWIPLSYKKRNLSEFDLPTVPAGVEIRRCPEDFGPATKILATCSELRTTQPDMNILYCDDDRIYAPEWATQFIAESVAYPDAAIASDGSFAAVELNKLQRPVRPSGLLRRIPYQIAKRNFKKHERDMFARARLARKGFIDIAKGFGGVLVKPKFFPTSAYDIPERLWAVDDIWLSGQLALNKVGIKLLDQRASSRPTAASDIDALLDMRVNDDNRIRLNAECIRYFQDRFGIWQPQ